MATLATLSERDSKALTVWAAVAFVPVGVVTVILGPLLPSLSSQWALDYKRGGFLFTVQFAVSTLGAVVSGWMIRWRGYRITIVVGLLAMSIGLSMLTSPSFSLGVAGIACYGWALGVAIPACNLLVAEVNPTARSAALSRLNFSWSAGAVLCPFLVAFAIKNNRLPFALYLVAASLLLVSIAVYSRVPELLQQHASEIRSPTLSARSWRLVFTFLLLFFLYVGIENAIGGWAASYAKVVRGGTTPLALSSPSLFYGALMCGRWLGPYGLRIISEVNFARFGLLIATAGMSGLVLAHDLRLLMFALIVIGFGLSVVYPITISLLSKSFGPEASRIAPWMFTVANLGGASLPWFVGLLSSVVSSLRVGLLVPLVACTLMLILYQGSQPQTKD